jgi:vacuolar-type H+-ATPase subunit I/STV1
MKKVVIIKVSLFLLLVLVACSSDSEEVINLQNELNKVEIELKQERDKKNTQVTLLEEELANIKSELEKVKENRAQLSKEIESYKSEKKDISEVILAGLAKTLFYREAVTNTYNFVSDLQVINGWYSFKDSPEIKLQGYDDAKSVTFKIAILETDMPYIVVGVDNSYADGWIFNEPINDDYSEFAFWAEITKKTGEVVRTPILPIRIKK